MSEPFEKVSWGTFKERLDWRQGEHVTMIGTTGQGKTTLTKEIIDLRSHVMVLRTKKYDPTLDAFEGFHKSRVPQDWMQRVMVMPPFPRDPGKLYDAQRNTFYTALSLAYNQGRWAVVADEVRYLCQQLQLKGVMETLWLQGRSLGVSIVASTQRPRHIPLEAYDQATHLFFWRDSDRQNVARIAEIGGFVDTNAIMERVPQLPQYCFIYVNTRTGTTLESKVEVKK